MKGLMVWKGNKEDYSLYRFGDMNKAISEFKKLKEQGKYNDIPYGIETAEVKECICRNLILSAERECLRCEKLKLDAQKE